MDILVARSELEEQRGRSLLIRADRSASCCAVTLPSGKMCEVNPTSPCESGTLVGPMVGEMRGSLLRSRPSVFDLREDGPPGRFQSEAQVVLH